jgi:hypothetical protein
MKANLKLAMSQHMGITPRDTSALDRDLVRSFAGEVVKCPDGVARGSHFLQRKQASALPMGFYGVSRVGPRK